MNVGPVKECHFCAGGRVCPLHYTDKKRARWDGGGRGGGGRGGGGGGGRAINHRLMFAVALQ